MQGSVLAAFYDAHVRELADQHKAPVRKQMEKAFLEKPPSSVDAVDGWFEESFHKAPVSHDTRLFNQLQAMKAGIRDVFASPEKTADAQ